MSRDKMLPKYRQEMYQGAGSSGVFACLFIQTPWQAMLHILDFLFWISISRIWHLSISMATINWGFDMLEDQ